MWNGFQSSVFPGWVLNIQPGHVKMEHSLVQMSKSISLFQYEREIALSARTEKEGSPHIPRRMEDMVSSHCHELPVQKLKSIWGIPRLMRIIIILLLVTWLSIVFVHFGPWIPTRSETLSFNFWLNLFFWCHEFAHSPCKGVKINTFCQNCRVNPLQDNFTNS